MVVSKNKSRRLSSGHRPSQVRLVEIQLLVQAPDFPDLPAEIEVAQKELIPALELEGRLVSLDALHTQDETARAVVLEGGGDYFLTVKNNQPTLRANIEKKVTAPRADFPPRPTHIDAGADL